MRKHLAERIKEVEGRLSPAATVPIAPRLAQAPSTLRAIELHNEATEAYRAATPQPAPIVIPGQILDKETGRPSIPTGNGTRGPRKF